MAIAKYKRFSFSKLGQFGRLGNQLFQIAATIGMALKEGGTFHIPKWKYSLFFPKAPAASNIQWKHELLTEPAFNHNELILDESENYDLEGYFQSELNFYGYDAVIRHAFQFAMNWRLKLYNKYFLPFEGKTTCAVHVRRGDYVENGNYYQLGLKYYLNAMAQMGWMEFIVFSDDIEWCKRHMPDWCHFMHAESDVEDICLMSMCDHFIIANSSFSWWGAWLGEKKHTRVIAPDHWFSGTFKYKNNSKDIIPDRWEKINLSPKILSNGKIDLRDVTFTIPIRIDHQDRIDNLKLIIDFLNYHFHTNIIVYEDASYPQLEKLPNVKYHFRKNDKAFHRTQLLNIMAMEANTPIISNYDCDVVFKPAQLFAAAEMIRKGQADGVSPYDGMFLRAWRTKLGEFAGTFNVDCLDLGASRKEHYEHHAVGGAIFWNKKSFIAGGMENEYMISYGPEDYERIERFKKLGYKLDRVDGPLIHIDHWVGVDSTESNPHFKKNWREYRMIQGFSSVQLDNYIRTWPWRKNAMNGKF